MADAKSPDAYAYRALKGRRFLILRALVCLQAVVFTTLNLSVSSIRYAFLFRVLAPRKALSTHVCRRLL